MHISFFYSIVKSVRFTAPHDAAKFLYSNSSSNNAAYDKKIWTIQSARSSLVHYHLKNKKGVTRCVIKIRFTLRLHFLHA